MWKCMTSRRLTQSEAVMQEGNYIVMHYVVQYNQRNHINSWPHKVYSMPIFTKWAPCFWHYSVILMLSDIRNTDVIFTVNSILDYTFFCLVNALILLFLFCIQVFVMLLAKTLYAQYLDFWVKMIFTISESYFEGIRQVTTSEYLNIYLQLSKFIFYLEIFSICSVSSFLVSYRKNLFHNTLMCKSSNREFTFI
jgi:hypothetical protein